MSYRGFVTINVLRLFFTVLWVGLQYVIVVFPDHTHLLLFVYAQVFYTLGSMRGSKIIDFDNRW